MEHIEAARDLGIAERLRRTRGRPGRRTVASTKVVTGTYTSTGPAVNSFIRKRARLPRRLRWIAPWEPATTMSWGMYKRRKPPNSAAPIKVWASASSLHYLRNMVPRYGTSGISALTFNMLRFWIASQRKRSE